MIGIAIRYELVIKYSPEYCFLSMSATMPHISAPWITCRWKRTGVPIDRSSSVVTLMRVFICQDTFDIRVLLSTQVQLRGPSTLAVQFCTFYYRTVHTIVQPPLTNSSGLGLISLTVRHKFCETFPA